MPVDTDKSTKERILDSAVRLFAQRGYSACGMRDIVREAGVSIAMVNYHFGSKPALLEEIINRFSGEVFKLASHHLAGSENLEIKLRRYIRAMIKLFREKPDSLRIMITELPLDLPEIISSKAEHVNNLIGLARDLLLSNLPSQSQKEIRLEIVGPALIGMLSFHFLVTPVMGKAFGIRFDNEFYEGYADDLADLFLFGISAKTNLS